MSGPFVFLHSTHRVQFGPGCLSALPDLARAEGRRKAAILLDAYFMGGPLQDRLSEILKDFAPVFHAVPQHEPDTDTVEGARAALSQAEADLILAVGGGSTLDTAKAARMLLRNPMTACSLRFPRRQAPAARFQNPRSSQRQGPTIRWS